MVAARIFLFFKIPFFSVYRLSGQLTVFFFCLFFSVFVVFVHAALSALPLSALCPPDNVHSRPDVLFTEGESISLPLMVNPCDED